MISWTDDAGSILEKVVGHTACAIEAVADSVDCASVAASTNKALGVCVSVQGVCINRTGFTIVHIEVVIGTTRPAKRIVRSSAGVANWVIARRAGRICISSWIHGIWRADNAI